MAKKNGVGYNMINKYISYYKQFHCIAQKCPDSCCTDWDVVIDSDTLKRFQKIDKIRNSIIIDEDNDYIFKKNGENCPFFNKNHLCDIQSEYGEEMLCKTCKAFPRITNDYGTIKEYNLSCACPEATRLLLQASNLYCFSENDNIPLEQPTYDSAWMQQLLSSREILFSLWKEKQSVGKLLVRSLIYAEQWQDVADDMLICYLSSDNIPKLPSYTCCQEFQQQGDLKSILHLHGEMEVLTEDWNTLCQSLLKTTLTSEEWKAYHNFMQDKQQEFRNIAWYYCYRYWLQAVFDYDVLSKIKRLAVACIMISAIECMLLRDTGSISFSQRVRVVQLYSKEVEHSEKNQQILEDAFYCLDGFSDDNLCSLLLSQL